MESVIINLLWSAPERQISYATLILKLNRQLGDLPKVKVGGIFRYPEIESQIKELSDLDIITYDSVSHTLLLAR